MHGMVKHRFHLSFCSVLENTTMVITEGYIEIKVVEMLCTSYGNIFIQVNSNVSLKFNMRIDVL